MTCNGHVSRSASAFKPCKNERQVILPKKRVIRSSCLRLLLQMTSDVTKAWCNCIISDEPHELQFVGLPLAKNHPTRSMCIRTSQQIRPEIQHSRLPIVWFSSTLVHPHVPPWCATPPSPSLSCSHRALRLFRTLPDLHTPPPLPQGQLSYCNMMGFMAPTTSFLFI